MVCLWLLFAAILFIAEPLSCTAISALVQPRDRGRLRLAASGALGAACTEHLTILDAVAGSQGWSIF